jgi:ribosomal protein S27E
MSKIANALEAVVVAICLPFYAIAFPLMRLGEYKAAKRIAALTCPWCHQTLATVTRRDLQTCGIRLRLTRGAKVDWQRLPHISVRCPGCSREICFDQQFRTTACDHSDAITHPVNPL